MPWYVDVFYADPAYGPEFGDENPDRGGPFETEEKAEDWSDGWGGPFGTAVYWEE